MLELFGVDDEVLELGALLELGVVLEFGGVLEFGEVPEFGVVGELGVAGDVGVVGAVEEDGDDCDGEFDLTEFCVLDCVGEVGEFDDVGLLPFGVDCALGAMDMRVRGGD